MFLAKQVDQIALGELVQDIVGSRFNRSASAASRPCCASFRRFLLTKEVTVGEKVPCPLKFKARAKDVDLWIN
jgi:hypothetical protein